MIADGDVFVVGQERIVGTEETSNACGVVDGGVEVGVVGDAGGLDDGRPGDGVEGGFGGLAVSRFGVGVEEFGEGFAEKRPRARAEGHEWIEDGGLAGGGEAGRQETGCDTGMEIEQVGSDCDAEMGLAVE